MFLPLPPSSPVLEGQSSMFTVVSLLDNRGRGVVAGEVAGTESSLPLFILEGGGAPSGVITVEVILLIRVGTVTTGVVCGVCFRLKSFGEGVCNGGVERVGGTSLTGSSMSCIGMGLEGALWAGGKAVGMEWAHTVTSEFSSM